LRSRGDHAKPADGGSARARRRPDPIRRRESPTEELRPEMSIEYTQPGSALDAQLRREQSQAVLALLKLLNRDRGLSQ
jgi:hypothetical protein